MDYIKSKVLENLALAREFINSKKVVKLGHNKFSNYDYLTPEQVKDLVLEASKEFSLINIFNLIRDEFGKPVGSLRVYSLEDGSSVEFQQITDIPAITATNIAQQMGGMVTYSERYLSMTAYGIKDNSLDFDSQDNTTKNAPKTPEPKEAKETVGIDSPRFDKIKTFVKDGGKITTVEKEVSLTKEAKTELEKLIPKK